MTQNVAAYLELPGNGRQALYKKIAKLYDVRSEVAHGTSKAPPPSPAESRPRRRARIGTGRAPNRRAQSEEQYGNARLPVENEAAWREMFDGDPLPPGTLDPTFDEGS